MLVPTQLPEPATVEEIDAHIAAVLAKQNQQLLWQALARNIIKGQDPAIITHYAPQLGDAINAVVFPEQSTQNRHSIKGATTLLNIAVAANNLEAGKALVEAGADFSTVETYDPLISDDMRNGEWGTLQNLALRGQASKRFSAKRLAQHYNRTGFAGLFGGPTG